jgi:hypothetical protein
MTIDDRGAVMLARFGVLIRTAHVAAVLEADLRTGLRVLERFRREGRAAPVTEAEWAAIVLAVTVMEARLRRGRPESLAA